MKPISDTETIRIWYQRGLPVHEIAARAGVSRTTVWRIVKAAGIDLDAAKVERMLVNDERRQREHGTYGRYRSGGCRCERCRTAHRLQRRLERLRDTDLIRGGDS